MHTPRYLKYLQFSEAFFNGIGKECYAICRIDHHASRGIAWYSRPPMTFTRWRKLFRNRITLENDFIGYEVDNATKLTVTVTDGALKPDFKIATIYAGFLLTI